MATERITATRIQLMWLRRLEAAWQMRPGPNDYFPAQQIWDEIRQGFSGQDIDADTVSGALNSLLNQGLVHAVSFNDSQIAIRITDEGRRHFAEARKANSP